jgi:hypothetical protein
VTPASLAADPDQVLTVGATNIAKPKPRASPYHRLRPTSYGKGSSSDTGPSCYDAPPLPVGEPPAALLLKSAIEKAEAFEVVQDSNIALCVELGEPAANGATSAEHTLLNWCRHAPEITEMLDEQVASVFQKVPGCYIGGHDTYKSARNWYWWYYDDCRPGTNHSGWYLSSALWTTMTKEMEVMIS